MISEIKIRLISYLKKTKPIQKIAIVGKTRLAYELYHAIANKFADQWIFAGFFNDEEIETTGFETVSGGNLQQLADYARVGDIDTIYIAFDLTIEASIKKLIEELADSTATVYYVPDLYAFRLLKSKIYIENERPMISIYDPNLEAMNSFIKRLFDIILSASILTVIAIPLVLIGLGIKLTSRGNILFKQHRYGLKGEEIVIWKFRTMKVTEDGDKVEQVHRGDSRVTRFGAFLRRYSLDELPQFINVIQGRMSVVGPRPHAVVHNQWYRQKIRGYMLRHKVKPGITGWAQINGCRGETDTLDKMEKRVMYDLDYIKNWSLWLDIKIVWLTIYKIISGQLMAY